VTLPPFTGAKAAAADGKLILSCRQLNPARGGSCLGGISALGLAACCLKGWKVAIEINPQGCQECSPGVFGLLQKRIDEVEQFLDQLGISRTIGLIQLADRPTSLSRRSLFSQCWSQTQAVLEKILDDEVDGPKERKNLVDLLAAIPNILEKIPATPLFFGGQLEAGCDLCGLCAKVCQDGALELFFTDNLLTLRHNQSKCSGCGVCGLACSKKVLQISATTSSLGVVRDRAWVNLQQSMATICSSCGTGHVLEAQGEYACAVCRHTPKWSNQAIY
jgi:ferredoxin